MADYSQAEVQEIEFVVYGINSEEHESLTGGRRNDPLAKLLGDPSHERRQAG